MAEEIKEDLRQSENYYAHLAPGWIADIDVANDGKSAFYVFSKNVPLVLYPGFKALVSGAFYLG